MMMHFRDRDTPRPHLEIVSDKRNPNAKVLALEVQPPVIGAFSLDGELSTLHLAEWSKKETKDVMSHFSGKATVMDVPLLKSAIHREVAPTESSHPNGCFNNWSVPPSGFGKVCYTLGYWEWVEDVLPRYKEVLECVKVYDAIYVSLFTYDYDENVLHAFCELWRPSTNTLSTFIGEMSISLWDLQTIAGLPIHGSFYDEVVPSAKELTQMDNQGKPWLPKSCLYLFSAFYKLAEGGRHEVSIHDWVKFWFRGPSRYAEPPQKASKGRATKPRLNHNPSGHIDMNYLPRTDEEHAPFVELGVLESQDSNFNGKRTH